MKKLKICFVTVNCSPEYLGGYSLYHKNLIKYIKNNKNNIKISWVYFGSENKRYFKGGVEYFEIKTNKLKSFTWVWENFSLARFFKKNNFDIINSTVGIGSLFYKKKKDQKIIQTFHGTAYYFNKNHFKRFNFIEKLLFSPLLLFSWLQEKPHKETDKFICVSEKVKRQIEKLYGKKKNIIVIRSGVDLKDFKPKNKKELRLNKNKIRGLYVGRGGFWTKGLDKTIRLSKELYNLNKNYKLILIGPDYNKVKHLLKEPFITLLDNIPREKMPLYYNNSDIFFCMSRYEGGAPTLVVSEAMASGCLVVCAKSAEQEIIQDSKNGLIVEEEYKKEAKRITQILKTKRLKDKILKNSMKTVKNLSFEKWGGKYLDTLIN